MEPKDIGNSKTYTHRQHLFINDDGEIIVMRMSFDKNRIFIRSVNRMVYVNGFDGKPVRKYIPLAINLSSISEELLGVECQTSQTN